MITNLFNVLVALMIIFIAVTVINLASIGVAFMGVATVMGPTAEAAALVVSLIALTVVVVLINVKR